MTSLWLDRALDKLWPPVQLWVHYPDSEGKRAKAELLDAYDSLGPREKAAYDADVRQAFLRAHDSDHVIAYRRVKSQFEPVAGLSMSTLEPGARSDAYSVSVDDVLVHWAQAEMPLSSRAYGHEKEIILRRDAEPVPVGEVKENPTLLPRDKQVIDSFLSKKPKTGKALDSDGRTLRRMSLGSEDIAVWMGDKIVEVSTESTRFDQQVLRYLRKSKAHVVSGYGKPSYAKGLRFEVGGEQLYRDQWDGYVLAYVPGDTSPIGKLNYSVYEGRYQIKMVNVKPAYRRFGVAKAMYQHLMAHDKISWDSIDAGTFTDEGYAFRKAVDPGFRGGDMVKSNPTGSKIGIRSVGLAELNEYGRKFSTGAPVTFEYLRGTEKSPRLGSRFQQDIEPAGRYMTHLPKLLQSIPRGLESKYESGEITFRNPIVLTDTLDDELYGEHSWKARLRKYFKAKGRKLSEKIASAGYDGIVTVRVSTEPKFSGEIVDLTMFHPASNPTGSKIVEILSVIDTREYEEVADGVFKPIAGSGHENECDRCGRMHEVHAHVRLESGETAVVGTGCMRGESIETTKAVTKAANAAKRLGALKAEYKKLTEQLAAWDEAWNAAWEEILTLKLPEPVRKMHRWIRDEEIIQMGDGNAMLFLRHMRGSEPTRDEMEDLIRQWRLDQMEAKGFNRIRHDIMKSSLKEVEKRIRKLIPPPPL
ncbi:MAG: hypothetical protein WC565_03460 [Parcubacteria group bacterium]